MLLQLYKQRYTSGRTLSAVVLFAWLSLLFQTCAMAASAPAAACDEMSMTAVSTDMHGQGAHDMHGDMGDMDCCPPAACASMNHDETLNTATLKIPGMDLSDVATLLPEPVKLPRRSAAFWHHAYYNAVYPPPHPTIRFCVLRI